MQRRSFLKKAGFGLVAGTGAATLASPVFAQNAPKINWRLASSFPTSADAIFNGGVNFSKFLSEATGGNFNVRVHHPGEIVPALQVLDAVQNGTVQAGHSAAYYYFGKDPVLCFDAAVPFGMNTRQLMAWVHEGNGLKLMREAYDRYNIVNFPLGYSGTQMGGWFRKEIKTPQDLQGLKFRCSAFAGAVLSRLGVVPQQVAGGDIYPSLEKGTIDAAEWIGPYDDEKMGFHKVAPYYYYPGWFEGALQLSLYINKDAYMALPASYQSAIMQASVMAGQRMLATYDTRNVQALRRLVASGAKLRPYSRSILEASHAETLALYKEMSDKDPFFKKVYTDYNDFREETADWLHVGERSFDNYMYNYKQKSRSTKRG